MAREKYIVQIAIVKEFEVTATDELQAEKEAFAKLGHDKDNAIAMCVLEPKHSGGALDSDDLMKNWKFARENFYTINREWCEG